MSPKKERKKEIELAIQCYKGNVVQNALRVQYLYFLSLFKVSQSGKAKLEKFMCEVFHFLLTSMVAEVNVFCVFLYDPGANQFPCKGQ